MEARERSVLAIVAMAIVSLAGLWPVATSARTLTFDDLRKGVSLNDPQISPDGKQIVLLVSRPDFAKDTVRSEFDLIDVASGARRPLTHDRMGLGSPRWSPDGATLAFLASVADGSAEEEQLFTMPMAGGEALALTHAPNGVQQFAWSPDGSKIAYVTQDDSPDKAAIAKHRDGFVVGDNNYLARAADVPSHIWIVNADGTGNRRLTSGPWSVPASEPPGPPGSPLSWSPDGSKIAITRLPNAVYGDYSQGYVAIVDVASGDVRPLTQHGKYEGIPQFSPDGAHVAYWYPRDGDVNGENEIYVAPASGGNGDDSTRAIDSNLQRAIWMPDGKTLLVGGHAGTRAAMWLQPVNGAPRRIDTGDVNPNQPYWMDASVGRDGSIAFIGTTAQHPSELYFMASATAAPKQLTTDNNFADGLDLGRIAEIKWRSDGFDEDGAVTLPPGFDPAKKYPLVLVIHGGPNSASLTSWSSSSQMLAANGCIVFNPNYRGSDNLGETYWHAIVNDAGAGPGRDVMAGIAAVEAAYPVDESRIAVSGWSYGGYMTSWMEGHYHIWKAAVAGAAVNNLVDEYALSDNNVSVAFGFNGLTPWSAAGAAEYAAQSPITFAAAIDTPTLIMSDVGDVRVPITQSYAMYHALKDRGVTVEFWAYPVSGHSPGDPVRAEDVQKRWVAWLLKYVR
jgi:dipeptidyl aminopeptidase/acylaminoacyl peptidase